MIAALRDVRFRLGRRCLWGRVALAASFPAHSDASAPASAEDESVVAAPAADPDAEPGEGIELRGEVEPEPRAGFDPDLLRRRMAGCFERMLRR